MSNYNVITPPNVRKFITNLFTDPEIKASASVEGSVLYNIISKIENRPLFYFEGNKASRLNFNSWYGLLDLRSNTYAPSQIIVRDLYFLHELNHLATINYCDMNDAQWRFEHTRNETASSMWSEALVYFEYPSLYEKTKHIFPSLWVTPYLHDEIQLIAGISNRDLYKKIPVICSALLFQAFANISVKPYSKLTELEKRTKKYDYFTEAWCDGNACLQRRVNQHQLEYRYLLQQGKVAEAVAMHHKWLVANTAANGVIFNNEQIAAAPYFEAARRDSRATDMQLKYKISSSVTMQTHMNKCTEAKLQDASFSDSSQILFELTKAKREVDSETVRDYCVNSFSQTFGVFNTGAAPNGSFGLRARM